MRVLCLEGIVRSQKEKGVSNTTGRSLFPGQPEAPEHGNEKSCTFATCQQGLLLGCVVSSTFVQRGYILEVSSFEC